MEEAIDYQVRLDVFQGPLDLLLFLIRKKKIDIHDIPIRVITREYLDYLQRKEEINLEREGEFLLMAALLIHIKSQMLLPRERLSDEEEDPRKSLVDRLLDHQRILAASRILRDREARQMTLWRRNAPPPLPPDEEPIRGELSAFDLAEAFLTLMKKREKEDIRLIQEREYSLEEKMEEILRILREEGYLDFTEYFRNRESVAEALVAFFCLLELIRARVVVALQRELFHPIQVWPRQESHP